VIFMAKMADFRYSWGMSDEPENTPSMMTDNTPEARAWRREQANVDADIEGLAKLPPADQEHADYVDSLDASDEEKIALTVAYYKEKYGNPDLANIDSEE